MDIYGFLGGKKTDGINVMNTLFGVKRRQKFILQNRNTNPTANSWQTVTKFCSGTFDHFFTDSSGHHGG
jgi:hypothetical protein